MGDLLRLFAAYHSKIKAQALSDLFSENELRATVFLNQSPCRICLLGQFQNRKISIAIICSTCANLCRATRQRPLLIAFPERRIKHA
jgi:hypothetical protein